MDLVWWFFSFSFGSFCEFDASDTLGFFGSDFLQFLSISLTYSIIVSFSLGVVGCLIHVTYRMTRIN